MFKKLSIQSKLTLMLIGVSVGSSLVIAFIGYRSGKEALTNSIYNQLTSLRFTNSELVENYFNEVKQHVVLLADNPSTIDAALDLKLAYQKLNQTKIENDLSLPISQYYTNEFLPKLKPNIKGNPITATFEPKTNRHRYLQYHYTIKSSDFDEKAAIDNAGDGSDFSKQHGEHHPFLRNFIDAYQHEDLFFIDPSSGEIYYTIYKGIDFATNLKTGYLKNSLLAKAFDAVLREPSPGFYIFEDYQPYLPSHNDPAAIIASPIFKDGALVSILAVQISSDPINKLMTYNQKWKKAGLGETGETFLVGPDLTMRSNSRFFLETPKEYFQDIAANGSDEETIAKIKRSESTILTQTIDTEATQQSSRGKEGTELIQDYRNVPVLSSYAPINILGKKWSIIAEMDEAEAFIPIQNFQKRVFISTALLVLGITLLALIISHFIVQPLRILRDGFMKLGEGNMKTKLNFQSEDEYQELALAFNQMVRNLNTQAKLVHQKSEENEKLLLSILPEPIAKRIKSGEEKIADSHANVSVLFADLTGFAAMCDCIPAEESVQVLNELVSSFDDSLERYGVEKVKTIGSGYMAAGGLSIQRIDHIKRIVDFGLNMIRIVQVYNRTNETDLSVQIGIHTGPVVAGVVGKSKFIYDLWGDTVGQANWVKRSGKTNTIQVTESIYQQIKDFYQFEVNHSDDQEQDTWFIIPS